MPSSPPKSIFLDFLMEKSVTFLSSPTCVRCFSIIPEILDSGTGNIPTVQTEPGASSARGELPLHPKIRFVPHLWPLG